MKWRLNTKQFKRIYNVETNLRDLKNGLLWILCLRVWRNGGFNVPREVSLLKMLLIPFRLVIFLVTLCYVLFIGIFLFPFIALGTIRLERGY